MPSKARFWEQASFFFSSRRRHTRYIGDWSSDVCSSDLTISPTSFKARAASRRSRPPCCTHAARPQAFLQTASMNLDRAKGTKSALSKRAALLAVAKVAGYALTLPLPLVLVRVLTQSDFGLYKQAFQVITTMLTLLGLQVALSIYYFLPRYPDRKPHVVMNVLVFYAALGGAMALLFAVYP